MKNLKNLATMATLALAVGTIVVLTILFLLQSKLPTESNKNVAQQLQAARQTAGSDNLNLAIEQVKAALEGSPSQNERLEANRLLGTYYLEQANYSEAIKHYQIAEELVKNDVNIMLALAEAYEGSHDKESAANYYRQAVTYYQKSEEDPGLKQRLIRDLEKKIKNLES